MTALRDEERPDRRAAAPDPWRLTLVAALVVSLLAACSSGDADDEPSAASSVSASRSSSPSAASTADQVSPSAHVVTGLTDVFLSSGAGLVVAFNPQGVVAIDPESEQVRWRADVTGSDAAVGLGSVWVADFDANLVRRLDVHTGQVRAEIPVPDNPIAIMIHRGQIWVAAHRGGSVSRIDPGSNEVASVTRVGPTGPRGPMDVAAAGDSVFVGVFSTNQVVRLDASSAKVTRRFTLPQGVYACGGMTPDRSVLWVTSCLEGDHVARVDLRTGQVTSSGALRMYVGEGVLRGDVIWFAGRPASSSVPPGFVGLDRRTLEVVGRLETEDTLDGSVAAFGSWWVTQGDGVARFRLEDLVPR
jgi:streptogramin lyase